MRGLLVPTCKFVGTISLGLLTGVSYASATQTVPSLLQLPTAKIAETAHAAHAELTDAHTTTLGVVSAAAFLAAWVLSPPRARHPYLAWVALTVTAGQFASKYMSMQQQQAVRRRRVADMQEAATATDGSSSPSSEEGYEEIRRSTVGMSASASQSASSQAAASSGPRGLNGEEVRRAMESWRRKEVVLGAVNAVGFFMAVVGVWGDRSGVIRAGGRR